MTAISLLGSPEASIAACRTDQVNVGTVCVDKYEASVWSVPFDPSRGQTALKALFRRIYLGVATVTDMANLGATQLGISSDNYVCADDGQDCAGQIVALSVAGVAPSTYITWFQAQQACVAAGKLLLTNEDWQATAAGTPDDADDAETRCNTSQTGSKTLTGGRSACVSSYGAFDMAGNADEWVAEWVLLSTGCWNWGGLSNDWMCLGGADETSGPGAITRGGAFTSGSHAGPLSTVALNRPDQSSVKVGFRCARHK